MFKKFVASEYETREFEHGEFESQWRARRQTAIDAALSGTEIPVADVDVKTSATPDLMSVLEASVAEAKPKSKPKKRAKVAA